MHIYRIMMFFSVRGSAYQLACTVAAVSDLRPVEHAKHDLQNITTEWMTHSAPPFKPCSTQRLIKPSRGGRRK